MNVGGEFTSGDGGYYSTSPLGQLTYQTRTSNTTQQITPQTPNTPTIVLTGYFKKFFYFFKLINHRRDKENFVRG